MSMDFTELRALYGDLPLADLVRHYWTSLENSTNAPVPSEFVSVDGGRKPTERQLRALKDSAVAFTSGAYSRGYDAGYGD